MSDLDVLNNCNFKIKYKDNEVNRNPILASLIIEEDKQNKNLIIIIENDGEFLIRKSTDNVFDREIREFLKFDYRDKTNNTYIYNRLKRVYDLDILEIVNLGELYKAPEILNSKINIKYIKTKGDKNLNYELSKEYVWVEEKELLNHIEDVVSLASYMFLLKNKG